MLPEKQDFRLPRGVILALWVGALGVLLAGLGTPVVQRTQEARVLETAREMLASKGWDQWMIPVLNGQVRMHKPPGAYWVAAAGFKVFGIGEFGGRFFFAVAGWLTLGLSYQFGRKLIYESAGLFAAGMLLGSFMFFRYFRLAETDALATLFVTAGIYWLWQGSFATGARSVLRFHLAGVMIGLAVLAKGPPAAFPLIFFLVWVVLERKWTALSRFLTSGALLTAVVVGGSWFAFIWKSPHAHVLKEELWVVTGGEDHKRPFYIYFPLFLTAPLPWTGVLVLGLVRAVARWTAEPAPRLLLVWTGTILIPLCFLGNKQVHYLLPIAPPAALLGAYGIYRGLVGDGAERAAGRWVVGITLAVSLLAPVGIIYMARQQRGALQTLDLVLVVLILAAGVGAVSLMRRQGLAAAVIGYAVGVSLVFAVTFGRFLPSLQLADHRTIAAELYGKWGEGPYVFYGTNLSLPLIWNLRQAVPTAETREALEAALARNPATVVIAQTKNNVAPPPVPAGLVEAAIYRAGDEGTTFRIYVSGGVD